jgi:hypothetical protein
MRTQAPLFVALMVYDWTQQRKYDYIIVEEPSRDALSA